MSRFEASCARSIGRSSRRSASIIDSSSARCSGLIERISDCIAAIRWASWSMMSSNVWAPGKKRPCFREEFAHVGLSTADLLADQPIEVAHHVAVGGEVLGRHRPDRLAHARHELIEDLLAESLDERIETLAGIGLEEVVLAQVADPLAEVGRERVEAVEPARRGSCATRAVPGSGAS